MASTIATNPSWMSAVNDSVLDGLEIGSPLPDGSAPHIVSVVSPNSNIASAKVRRDGVGDFAAWLVEDSVKRVFHPRPRGHSLMASLVLYHMEAENAIINPAPDYANNATTVWVELGAAPPLCPLQAPDVPVAQPRAP